MSRTELSNSDEWETPQWVFDQLCNAYDIHPTLDVAATLENSKCIGYLPKYIDALRNSWKCNPTIESVWCNPPHSKTKQFVEKAYEQWQKHNINILMIIPANSICTKYAEACIEGIAEYHPIFFRPKFLRDGKESKDPSRNSYFVVIWRKK